MHLTTTKSSSLVSFFKELKADELKSLFSPEIYSRGKSYYQTGEVQKIIFFDENSLKAKVSGSKMYKVVISKTENRIESSCNCPYDDTCKHIAAVALFAKNKTVKMKSSKVAPNTNKGQIFNEYLNSLSKEELIKLANDFAPESFINSIALKNTPIENAMTVFKKIKSSIKNLFSDDELLHQPAIFERRFNKRIEKLKSVWTRLPNEVAKFIKSIIKEIDEAKDAGYLWTENWDHGYGGEEYFEGEELERFIAEFLPVLPENQAITFKMDLLDLFDKSESFSKDGIENYYGSFFNQNELLIYKESYLNLLKTKPEKANYRPYYELKSVLTDEEKIEVLKHFSSNQNDLALELIIIYKHKQEFAKALDVANQYLKKGNYYPEVKIFYEKINLQKGLSLPIEDDLKYMLKHFHTVDSLEFANDLLPENKSQFEAIVKEKDILQYFNYLEKNSRLPEAQELIIAGKIDKYAVESFYKKHKQALPTEAMDYFTKKIDLNLQDTGDYYYKEITDSLVQIKSLDKTKFLSLINSIKLNYKRRSNLMKMIDKIEFSY